MRGPILIVELINCLFAYTAMRPSHRSQLKTVSRADTYESSPSEKGVNSKWKTKTKTCPWFKGSRLSQRYVTRFASCTRDFETRLGRHQSSVVTKHMHTYICDFFVCFGSYLFVRELLAKPLSMSTQEGRPEPVVEVWARSEHCSSRGVLSKFFSGGSGSGDFPGFFVLGLFCTYVPVIFLSVFVALSHEHTSQDTYHR